MAPMGSATNAGEILAPLLHRLGLPETLLSPLIAHALAVQEDADRLGLVAPGDVAAVPGRHTADSLLFAVARPPAPGESWVDVGSGAGFPGLVLACCYPHTDFTLLEPLKRRAGFLDLQILSLGLANARVDPRRHEAVEDGTFDVATARALSAPQRAMPELQRLVREDGGLAIVAVGALAKDVPRAKRVRIGDLGDIDSPGTLFIMGRDP